IISLDDDISRNEKLLTSIKEAGKVNGLMTITYTENFKSFTNTKSYAFYSGVVPFEYSSGITIREKKNKPYCKQRIDTRVKSSGKKRNDVG
ncbi:MAG: transposase, partial [Ferruginibacter sp.]